MTAEWKLLCVDAINICGRKNIDCLQCEVRCTEIIKSAQRKLLEYLIAHPDKGEWTEENKEDCIKIRTLKTMLKQLEDLK